MKKKMSFTVFSLALPSLLFAILPVAKTLETPTIATYASSYAKSSLPTTINLNDLQEDEVREYYSGLDDLNLFGDELLKALKPILSNGQLYHAYDGSAGGDIWKMYEITDRDWTLSPASEILQGKYDPETNTIKNYIYGASVSAPGIDNPYVHLLYRTHDDESALSRAWNTHGMANSINGFDREHIWPKSRGFDDSSNGTYGARGDIHHLWPGDHYVNSTVHSNLAYGFVNPNKIDNDAGKAYAYDSGNYRGTSSSLGAGTVFEPQDCDKGDIARACFYMVARYNNLAGDDATIDSGNPNLFLDNSTSTATVSSTASAPVSIGILQDLLVWHKLDPVDEYEIHRNNLVYRNYTHNRNPFIDFPDWVDAIWGTSVYDEGNHKSSSYSSTPKGVANPKSDAVSLINEGEKPALSELKVEGTLSKTSYQVGESFDPTGLTIYAYYEDGSHKDITSGIKWATLSEGDTTAKGSYTERGITLEIEIPGIKVEKKQETPEDPSEKDEEPIPWIPIAIGIGVVVFAIILLIVLLSTKKGRKKAAKSVKKAVKKATKPSSSKKKKK